MTWNLRPSIRIRFDPQLPTGCRHRSRPRRARRAAFLSLGSIVSATSCTLVALRYSNCFACCATQMQPGGHGPSSAQCPKPNEQWHSITGSSNATQRSYSDTCSPARDSRTPPPTPRWVLTNFLRARALMILPSVGRDIPVSFTRSGICKPSGPARSTRPIETAAMATCREIISSFRLQLTQVPTLVQSEYTAVNKERRIMGKIVEYMQRCYALHVYEPPAYPRGGCRLPRRPAERNKP